MKNKSYYLKFLLLILLIIIISISVTYAYFQIKLSGIESVSTVSVGGSQLEIKYVGSNEIIADRIIPGWSDTKYFNVEIKNSTGEEVKYDINIEVVDSNFYTVISSDKGYMQYALKKCISSSNDTCNETLVDASIIDVQSGAKKVTTISTTETSGTTYYALEFIYPDTDLPQSQRGTDGELVHFSGYVTLVSSTNSGTPFATDSWATIAANIKSGNTSRYSVGDTRKIALDGFTNTELGSDGLYTVRVANNSNYDCDLDSKTACGFVVEFEDIITTYIINPAGTYNEKEYPYGTNVGGWPASAMYEFVNGIKNEDGSWDRTDTLFSKLPSDLQSVIIDTIVISGHGYKDFNTLRSDENWESVDKLYLLSTGEIYGDCLTSNCWDTASCPYNGTGATTTRQLDYYNGVTRNGNHEKAIKQMNGTSSVWWLRGADNGFSDSSIFAVEDDGTLNTLMSKRDEGLAPAFRIG